jgi:Leucine-rich repeat (LRR) protein
MQVRAASPLGGASSVQQNLVASLSPVCRALKTLLLGHNNLKVIPPGVFLLSGLEQLDLNHNRLTDAGGPWYHLSSLQVRTAHHSAGSGLLHSFCPQFFDGWSTHLILIGPSLPPPSGSSRCPLRHMYDNRPTYPNLASYHLLVHPSRSPSPARALPCPFSPRRPVPQFVAQ